MNEFFAVLKKEWCEVVRTKKLYIFMGIALAMVVFGFIILAVMQMVTKIPDLELDAALMETFKLTYGNATSIFGAFMCSYFTIALIIMLRSYMSREIKEKKWILPLESGIKPQNLVLARLLAITGTIMISALSAIVLHFILCLIFCKAGSVVSFVEDQPIITPLAKGTAIGNTLYSYAMLLIYLLFITVVILGINAATKKPAITVVVGLLLILVVDTILSSITFKVAGEITALQSFTPFAFGAQALAKTSLHWSCWLSASLTTIGIIVAMVLLSLSSIKIKGEKIK